METENEKEQPESGSESREPTEQEPPRSKLRDLRPEKDPMGAGNCALRVEAERGSAA
jgi:hypothetical protein